MDPFKTLILGTPPSRTFTGDATGLLTAANNLSDVADAATALTNLGAAPATFVTETTAALAARETLSGAQITATGSVIGTIPNGAAQFGLGDFGLRAQVLRSATATANALARSHASGNNRVELRTTTGNALILRFVDGSGSNTDYTFPTYTLPLNTPAALHVVADRDGNAILYDHAVSVASISIAASASVNIGSGNTAVADAVGAFLGTIQHVEWINVALTAAEVSLLHRFGWAALPQYVHEGGAGQLTLVAAVNGTGVRAYEVFSAVGTTGFDAATTVADGANGAGWLRSGLGVGKVYDFRYNLTLNSGTAPVVGIRAGVGSASPVATVVSATNSTGANRAVFIPNATTAFVAIVDAAQNADLEVRDAVISAVGLCGRWIFDGSGAGFQERDRSGGRRPLLLTTTGVQRLKSGDRIQVTATVAHTGAGNLQITGQAVLPDLGWRLVAVTAKASANVTIQAGNASGGAQIVGSTALTANTLTPLTLASGASKPSTVNAWSNASAAADVQYSLIYERDDIT
jgi:hypothetical protein